MNETKNKTTGLNTKIKEITKSKTIQPHIQTGSTDTKVNETSKLALFLQNKKNVVSDMNAAGKDGQQRNSGQRAFAKKNSRRSHYITKK
jgi:hypothetical protein